MGLVEVAQFVADAVLLELAVEGSFSDAEEAGGEEFIAFELADGSQDGLAFQFGNGEDAWAAVGAEGGLFAAFGFGVGVEPCADGLEGYGEIADVEDGAGAEGAGSFDGVFEFADVAGPVIGKHGAEDVVGEFDGDGGLAFDAGEEVMGEFGDVLFALAERGHTQADDVEAEVEVAAEFALSDHGGEVGVGGGEYAGVDRDGVIAADGVHGFILQGAEELGLEREGEFADFVEEDGASVGGGEHALFGGLAGGRAPWT